MSKQIVVKIKDGKSSIELLNFEGQGCDKVAEDFIGKNRVVDQRFKPEHAIQTEDQGTTIEQ